MDQAEQAAVLKLVLDQPPGVRRAVFKQLVLRMRDGLAGDEPSGPSTGQIVGGLVGMGIGTGLDIFGQYEDRKLQENLAEIRARGARDVAQINSEAQSEVMKAYLEIQREVALHGQALTAELDLRTAVLEAERGGSTTWLLLAGGFLLAGVAAWYLLRRR
jgi:LPXTG-motif cell wall-anchored protein